ncbi:TNF receptor-associated factor 5 [Chanos chanos]|uniref:TNF receptor-associated factor n=1 Tax=Chanos chanos TaxID=29144 RepID=A0A6J2VA72_CHACN|nr:TNF receptor-associated factor 5-like [Chanos chanos]
MAAEENECTGLANFTRQNSGVVKSWELEPVLANRTLRFVAKLEEQFLCPACGGIVLNPHQTGCGHIFCAQCIRKFIDSSDISKCPIDNNLIKSEEVFQDNCCKRELLNLEIYCTNSPECPHRTTLSNLQEHLKTCQYEPLQCTNIGCTKMLARKDLMEHIGSICTFRIELCHHCKKPYLVSQLLDHEKNTCPDVEVECPNKCSQMIKRNKLKDHAEECPEVETDCVYKKYGCSVRDKRGQVKVHEYTEFSYHVLLVLESNSKLEKQVKHLQQDMVLRQGELKERNLQVSNLDREVTRCDQTLSAVQRSMEEQKEHISRVQQELQDLRSVLGTELGRDELPALRNSLDSLRQQVAVTESLREHLGALEKSCQRHSRLLSIHAEQLQCNEERFRQLESTSYDGKLIWKVRDYRRKKEAGIPLTSPPFYTSRSGYKLCARVYLGGDSKGRGTHLSLYILLMRGDFDSLLPWPFRQSVTMTLLDQSGARSHLSSSFTPDPASDSFRRPDSDTNVATGFPRFVSHDDLETARNAVYIRDDTLFIRIRVDTTGLEDL